MSDKAYNYDADLSDSSGANKAVSAFSKFQPIKMPKSDFAADFFAKSVSQSGSMFDNLDAYKTYIPSSNLAETGVTQSSFMEGMLGGNNFGSNVAGLASAFTSLVSLPQMLKNAKLNYKINKTGLENTQADRALRSDRMASLNSYTSPNSGKGDTYV
jgi:hypothetical protein